MFGMFPINILWIVFWLQNSFNLWILQSRKNNNNNFQTYRTVRHSLTVKKGMNEGTCGVFYIFSQLFFFRRRALWKRSKTKFELFYLKRFSWFITLDICWSLLVKLTVKKNFFLSGEQTNLTTYSAQK